MSGQEPALKRRYWVLCSSGARLLYLENVNRALALPGGEAITFRYEEKIVSERFRELNKNAPSPERTPLKGDIAYLSYLDNRKKELPMTIYPVREATIQSVEVLGSTYIIHMTLECFINWLPGNDLSSIISKSAKDALPHWVEKVPGDPDKNEADGRWLAETHPLPNALLRRYRDHELGHLDAFESAATALTRGKDFSEGKRMFATITALDESTGRVSIDQDVLEAGRSYDLHVYHFLPGDDTHSPLENFRLGTTSDNPDVIVVGDSQRHLEASYDTAVFRFRVADDARDGAVNLGLNIVRVDDPAREPVYILRSQLPRKVKSARSRKLFFAVVIGAGLFGSQAITLAKAQSWPMTATILAALAFSMVAGLGAAFGLKTKV